MSEKLVRAQYTREFKLGAVRQVRALQAISGIAKVLGISKASLCTECDCQARERWTALAAPTKPRLSRWMKPGCGQRMLAFGWSMTPKNTGAHFGQDTLRGSPGFTK